jgi:hypothetical protein
MPSLVSLAGALQATTVETTPNAIATRAIFAPFFAIHAANADANVCATSACASVAFVVELVFPSAMRVVTEVTTSSDVP